MKINISNYEKYLLDYTENRLNSSEKEELENFLIQNPEFYEIITNSHFSSINSDNTITYANKGSLYKLDFQNMPISFITFNDFCIAWYEKILTTDKKEELQKFINLHPELKKEFIEYEKTYFTPIYSIKYPDKKKLLFPKKNIHNINTRYFIWSIVAASILFLALLTINIATNPVKESKPLLSINNTKQTDKTLKPKKEYNYLYAPQLVKQTNPIKTSKKQPHKSFEEISKEKTITREKNISTIKCLQITQVNHNQKPSDIAENKLLVQINTDSKKDDTKLDNDTTRDEPKIKSLIAFAENGYNTLSKITSENLELSRKNNVSKNRTTIKIKAAFFEFYRSSTP